MGLRQPHGVVSMRKEFVTSEDYYGHKYVSQHTSYSSEVVPFYQLKSYQLYSATHSRLFTDSSVIKIRNT